MRGGKLEKGRGGREGRGRGKDGRDGKEGRAGRKRRKKGQGKGKGLSPPKSTFWLRHCATCIVV
jgi:hypothetical protein